MQEGPQTTWCISLSPLAVYDAFHCSIDMQCTMLFGCFSCFVLFYL